jgi:hypothetical protein
MAGALSGEGYVLDSTIFVIPALPMGKQEKEPSWVKIGEGCIEPSCERPRYGHQPIAAGTRLELSLEYRIITNK